MGQIEITDGVTTRRQRVKELRGTVRIEVASTGEQKIRVPQEIAIERNTDESE